MTSLAHKLLLISWLLFFANSADATLSCQTGRTPGNVTGNVNYGTSINWANPNRSLLSDDLYSRTSFTSGDITKYLEDKDFRFAIPSDATITGVGVFIERYADAVADIHDYSMRLEINGVVVGTDHGTGNARWSTTEGIYQYGGAYDTWGVALTADDVNSSSFGVLTSIYIPSGGSSTVYFAYIDNVEVMVYFTTPSSSCGIYNLPVTLAEYKAKVIDDSKVKLTWLTYAEINNDFFSVERSSDGISYDEIATIKGIGNSTSIHNYEYLDDKPPPGISYYRLKQTDYDGTETIEKEIVAVNVSGRKDAPFSIYPNPSDGKSFQFSFSSPPGEELWFIVQDYSGKEVFSRRANTGEIEKRIFYFDTGLKPGVYTVFSIGASESFREKLLVKN